MKNKENKKENIDDLTNKILSKIEDDGIKPRSKWYFMVKNDFFWFVAVLSIVLGSMATSVIIYALTDSDIYLYQVTHDSFVSFIFDSLVFVWLIVFLLFIFIGYKNIHNTKNGYKHSFVIIAVTSFLISLLCGFALYYKGLADDIDRETNNYLPINLSVLKHKQMMWVNSSKGVLAGEVVSVSEWSNSAHYFVIRDFEGKEWLIDGIDLLPIDAKNIEVSKIVRIVGIPLDSSTTTFRACFVLPWSFGGGMMKNRGSSTPFVINERNFLEDRSNECKGVRPYELLNRFQK